MTFYSVEGETHKGWVEHIVTCEYAWQALYAIDALTTLVPILELSLRVSPLNGRSQILRVKGGRWRFLGATTRLAS